MRPNGMIQILMVMATTGLMKAGTPRDSAGALAPICSMPQPRMLARSSLEVHLATVMAALILTVIPILMGMSTGP